MLGRVIRQNVWRPLAPRLRAACSWSSPISVRTGHDLADHQRQRHETGGHDHAGRVEDDLEALLLQRRPEPAVAAVVDQQQREADDDRRHRQGYVDHRGQHPLAGELVAHQQDRDRHAEDQVDQHRPERHLRGEQQRVLHVRVRERVGQGGRARPRTCAWTTRRDRPGDQEEHVADRRAPAAASLTGVDTLTTACHPSLDDVERDDHEQRDGQHHARPARPPRRCCRPR